MGPDRLLALAKTALREVCEPLQSASALNLRLPLYLGLPELRPGFSVQDALAIQSGLAQMDNILPVKISKIKIFTQGHAAGLSAFSLAIERIRKKSFEACLIGGVDSYFHPDTMEWLDDNRQLAGAVSRSAFVPGEGAGFCLLMSEATCMRLRLNALGRVVVAALGMETKLIKTSDVCLGEGLTSAVRNAVNGLSSSQRINAVICDINGERYRGEEWGFVCLRLSQYFDDPTAYNSPADCWGDMGAASGPLFAMLACQAAVRGYANGPRTLLSASSEGGLRAAAVLDTGMSK